MLTLKSLEYMSQILPMTAIKTAVKQENITLILLTHIQKACND